MFTIRIIILGLVLLGILLWYYEPRRLKRKKFAHRSPMCHNTFYEKAIIVCPNIKKYKKEAIIAERCFIARYIGIPVEKIYPTDVLASYVIDGWEYDDQLYDLLQDQMTLQESCANLIFVRLLYKEKMTQPSHRKRKS